MTTTSSIEDKIKSFIINEFLPEEDPEQLLNTTELITSGVLDSIATLRLVEYLEREFSISIEPHEADPEHLDTIERIARLVAAKKES